MIVKSPENNYEKEILDIIKTDVEFSKSSDGEKSIVYDLCKQVRKTVGIPWEDIDLENYVILVFKAYKKSPNIPTMNVIVNCINRCFPNYKAYLEGTGSLDCKKIVIEEVKSKCIQ